MAPSGAPLLDGPTLIAAAEQRHGSSMRVQPSAEGWETDFHIYVDLDSGSLHVSHFADNMSISFDASEPEVREVLAWYRSLLPFDFPRVIACDQGWNGHVDLTPGITADEIMSNWIDHSVSGWDATDPDFAPAPE